MNVNKLIFLTLLATALLTSTTNAHAFGQAAEAKFTVTHGSISPDDMQVLGFNSH